jgi:hypothetical protein
MRRTLFAFLTLMFVTASWTVLPVARAVAQDQGDDSDAAKKKKKEEWELKQAPLPNKKNLGPCPFVKVLYDAARYEEFKDDEEASAKVAYTGEIEGVESDCTYIGTDPIKVRIKVRFQLGRGPQGTAAHKAYRYWIAVTQRNREVLAKQEFTLPVDFNKGQDRVSGVDAVNGIVIPRADGKVSGENFEILVGFDVTPEMADFNREGKRFRINAGAPVVAEAASSQQ